jgi:8-oxo-dGTP diphosphatase
MTKARDCTREQPHDGPCNGMPCAYVRAKHAVDVLRRLSPEELAKVPPITREQLDAALEQGRREREAMQAEHDRQRPADMFASSTPVAAARRPRLGVAMLLVHEGRFLLGQRGKEPNYGMWVLPGGGIEFGEHWWAAGAREFKEETGLSVEIDESVRPVVVEIIRDDEHRVILTVRASLVSGTLRAASDLLDARFFESYDLPALSPAAREMLLKLDVLPHSAPLNQCDGCRAGKPVDENGNHEMCDGEGAYSDLMACQRKKYETA